MEQEPRGHREAEPARRERRQQSTNQKAQERGKRKAWHIAGTVLLILLCSAVMFAGIFMYYVRHVLAGDLVIDADGISQKLTSTIMYQDENGQWQELQKLFGLENRVPVDIENLPDYVWQSVVAIEDKRFFKHHGVDWPRTLKATMKVIFTGDSSYGGSTLTQQLIKNITDDKQNTIKRKVTEIFRALELEKNYTKQEILEMYLNTVYFGSSSYGIGAAADTYFGKEAKDLTLAEAACIVGITNNPSMYNPLNEDGGWSRGNNKERQVTILGEMLAQGYITQAQYDEAKGETLHFVADDQTDQGDDGTTSADGNVYSYFVDQVIADVLSDLQTQYGYSYSTAQSLLFNGGYTIYATVNRGIQETAEAVFEDLSNTPYISSATGRQMQAAMTIIDPYTGNVVAMVGGVGEKTISRGQNLATVRRPCGSAIKPVSTYAPALENGTITLGSILDDAPVTTLNGKPWPKNYDGSYSGLTTISRALEQSMNTIAVRVNQALGVSSSFTFMKEKLGFTTLVDSDLNSAALALGGLTNGVTTEEMAAAYSSFVNNGIYTTPRTYTKVEDNDGKTILENNSESWVAMSETTACFMDQLLMGIVKNGNAGGARLSGMAVAGKTGTTTDNYDRYFVGLTPYYVGAVWCGYEYNESIRASSNPAVSLWKKVMSQVHSGLSYKGFSAKTSDVTTVTLCLDSGLLATDACAADIRGNRCQTVTIPTKYVPTASCNLHKMVDYCTEGKCIATAACPASSVIQAAVLDYTRDSFGASVADAEYLLSNLTLEVCPVHGAGTTEPAEPTDPANPTNPGDPSTDPTQPDTPTDPGGDTPNPGGGN